jgi:hypothetical protein
MDQLLYTRYLALLTQYEVGSRGPVIDLKKRIIDQMGLLRPDAALCLLTLYDQMILRPYGGSIFAGDKPLQLAVPEIGDSGFKERIDESFEIIIGELKSRYQNEPLSSHDVLLAISAVWKQLAVIFWWA